VAGQSGKKCCRDLFACRRRRHTGRDAGATEGTTNMVSTPKSAPMRERGDDERAAVVIARLLSLPISRSCGVGAALGLVTLLTLGQPATAAPSFDCATAGRPIEKIICGDPHLADLDAALAAAYAAKRATLGEDDAKSLVKDQRTWVKGLPPACGVPVRGDGLTGRQEQIAATCLEGAYERRLADLKEPAAEASAVPETHRDFIGLDLVATFPQLQVASEEKSLRSITNVFEKNDSNIIARYEICVQTTDIKHDACSYYDINIFEKKIDTVADHTRKVENSQDLLLKRDSTFTEFGNKVIGSDGLNPSGCDDPLVGTLSLSDKKNYHEIGSAKIIQKKFDKVGRWVGGDNCDYEVPRQRLHSYVETWVTDFAILSDQTFLVWSSLDPREIIHFDQNLRTTYRSDHVIVLDDEQMGALQGNPIERQKSALSMFNDHK
ncbi:lysozyme inhibitor LprI family protein, partial [Telmatospirillum sp.]|uniref:lysozyme inhibitor LprI family protein n=1 Tax=Telmatospirillum sp. TaxID=2079197 RepID=UPI002846C11F|nr:lysozyme inhibitor LprI family protein [Telmatospirillum sp.]